jgi:hypothetical protein
VVARTPTAAEGEVFKSEPQSVALSERGHQSLELKIVRPQSE